MESSKILFGVASFFAIILMVLNHGSKEKFINYPLTQIAQPVVARNPKEAEAGYFYAVPGTWQNRLSPRYAPSDGLKSAIRYNFDPNSATSAVPTNPLSRPSSCGGSSPSPRQTFANNNNINSNPMPKTKEGFCAQNGGGCTPVGIAPMQPNYANGNYNEVANRNGIPIKDLTGGMLVDQSTRVDGILNKVGDYTPLVEGEIAPMDAPVVLDRLMYSSQRSRVYAAQDPIRGSLPIAPHKPTADCMWFTVSAQPERDLNSGALAVLGGISDQSAKLAALKTMNSGNTVSTYSGINWLGATANTNSIDGALSQFQNTVSYSSFA